MNILKKKMQEEKIGIIKRARFYCFAQGTKNLRTDSNDIDTNGYIELCHFLKLLSVSMYTCCIRVSESILHRRDVMKLMIIGTFF
jgi:hypothetical protein